MLKTRKLHKNKKAGTVESAAKIKATVIAVKKNSKTIKNYKQENSILENRISLLESIVKKQEKQIDTLNRILIEHKGLVIKLEKALEMGYPIGADIQRDIEYAIKTLQGILVEKPNQKKWKNVTNRLKKLKDNWETVRPEGHGGFKAVYK